MLIAVEGCAHGELEKIYDCIETLQLKEKVKIDLLICCGDFQSVRNRSDLGAMAVPEKYQQMCTFYKYYSGEKKAPILTIFIGGNHEASNYLQELPYGGWVAPNIYYLGRSGVVNFGNLRIGGISGIFKGQDYNQGLWECLPYKPSSLRTVYHVRAFDVFRLSQLKEKVDVMLSHDWPRGITDHGDLKALLHKKGFLKEDIETKRLGSVGAHKLLMKLKPQYWFAAHLHCLFPAIVKHDSTETKFLALDKCLPKRRHLQIIDIPSSYDGDKCLKYDLEWLAVLKNTNHLLSVKNINTYMPGPGGNERYDFTPTEEEKQAVLNILQDMKIDENSFVRTAPIYSPNGYAGPPTVPILNPQTASLCEKLGIDDPVQVVMARTGRKMQSPVGNLEVGGDQSVDSSDKTQQETPDKESTLLTPVSTKCAKLSLPEPVTPNEPNENELFRECLTPDNLSASNSMVITDDSVTPMSSTKKAFKRRNISIYNTSDTEDVESTSITSEENHSGKVHRQNML